MRKSVKFYAFYWPSLIVLGLLYLAFASSAFAGSANVGWIFPTTYSDNSTLPVADLATTTVEYGTGSGTTFGTKAGQIVVNAPAITGSILNLSPGTWCFRMFVTTTAAKGGVSGPMSNVVCASVPFPTPGAGTITVTIQ